jgi:hypothetical protein
MSSKTTATVAVGVNIATAAEFYNFTATQTGEHRFQVRLANAAGNGDYVIYLMHQLLGSGTTYLAVPKTTAALASGETTPVFPTLTIDLTATDKVGIWIDGQATDNAVTGAVDIWVEDSVATVVAAIWDKLLTGITTAGSVGKLIKDYLDAAISSRAATGAQMDLINDAVDAASLAASAVAKIQSGLSTLTAADVWGFATRTLTSFGTLVASIWTYIDRTLTQAIASAIAALSGDSLAITVSDTWSQTLTGLRENTSYVSIDLVVKKQKKDDDEDAVIWIRKNASGSGDGLLYLNGATPVSPVVAGDGSITVASSTSLTFNLAARATAELIGNVDLNGLFYAVKYYFASEVATVQTGVCNVDEGVIRAIE